MMRILGVDYGLYLMTIKMQNSDPLQIRSQNSATACMPLLRQSGLSPDRKAHSFQDARLDYS